MNPVGHHVSLESAWTVDRGVCVDRGREEGCRISMTIMKHVCTYPCLAISFAASSSIWKDTVTVLLPAFRKPQYLMKQRGLFKVSLLLLLYS